jgi:hypothetical protein
MPTSARRVNRPRFIAKYNQETQRLYKLDSPVSYEKLNKKTGEYTEHKTSYVLCSNSKEGYCEPETMLFPANWRGKVECGFELAVDYPWNQDEEVLSDIGVIQQTK